MEKQLIEELESLISKILNTENKTTTYDNNDNEIVSKYFYEKVCLICGENAFNEIQDVDSNIINQYDKTLVSDAENPDLIYICGIGKKYIN